MRTYSFDIFDTCLIRACGSPLYVFDLLAERVLGQGASETMLMDFSSIRRNGEIRAREKFICNGIEEISLLQIYQECDFSSLTELPNDKIMRKEMELEKEVLVPVIEIKKKIAKIHEEGKRIIFISDMYLPTNFIQEVLINTGLFSSRDKLYVSSEIRKTKRTGNLYRFIHDTEKLNYREWYHTGDNKYSDIIVPRGLGIKATLIKHKYSTYERVLAYKETEGGKMNRYILSSISRAIRLSYESKPEFSVACDFVAPIYVPFVFSIMEHASKNHICDLYYLSRDGYIFYKISEVFKRYFPSIDIHYLYVSRKSLYLPSLTDINYESIIERMTYFNNCTVEEVCERLHLSEETHLFRQYKNLTGDELIKNLLSDKLFIEKLTQKRDEQQANCIRYFEQEGLTKGNSAIVDLTGSRKCHVYINNILSTCGYDTTYAYYFDVTNPHVIGNDYYSLFQTERYRFNKSIIKGPQSVFEQYFSISFHESMSSYEITDGMVVPKFCNTSEITDRSHVILNSNVLACQLFADYYLKFIDYSKSKDYIGDGLSVFNYFCTVPEYYYVQAFVDVCRSNSSLGISKIIEKRNFIWCVLNLSSLYWVSPSLVYNCRWHGLMSALCKIRYIIKHFWLRRQA